MNPFVRITMRKLALLFAAAAFTVSTPCFANKLSKAQGQQIGADIVVAEATARSAVGPGAVPLLAQAINLIGTGINTMVGDLSTVIPQGQAAFIKDLVVIASTTANNAVGQGFNQVQFQTLATSVNQLGNAINQLQGAVVPTLGPEINPIVTTNVGLFDSGVAAGNTQIMGLAISRLADGLGVIDNVLSGP